MNTAALCEKTRLHPNTIRAMVARKEIDATPVGGSHGFEFSDDAPDIVKSLLSQRHRERLEQSRKERAKK